MRHPSVIEEEGAVRGPESGSLARGLQVLGVLREHLYPMTHSEVASAAALPASTTHRLLQTLVEHRHVQRTSGGRYRLAPAGLLPLAMDHPLSHLRRDISPLLKMLCDRYGPSANLILYFGAERALLDTSAGRYSVSPYYDTHISSPFHTTVSGKLLLAHLSSDERTALLDAQPLVAWTSATIVDRAQMDRELAQIREEGFATNVHENVAGICACGAVLRSATRHAIGAIVLSGPDEFFAADAMEGMRRDLLDVTSLLNQTSLALRAVGRFLE